MALASLKGDQAPSSRPRCSHDHAGRAQAASGQAFPQEARPGRAGQDGWALSHRRGPRPPLPQAEVGVRGRPAWVYWGRLPVSPSGVSGGPGPWARRGPPGLLGATAPAHLPSAARLKPGGRYHRELTCPRRPRAGGGNGLGPRGLQRWRRPGPPLRQRPCW